MRKLGHVPALDALRGIAIALVLGGHAAYLIPGGGLGVDLFFVLSGFLITSLLLNEWHERGRVNLIAFYRRRALRLLPALVVMLGVYCLVVSFLTLIGQHPKDTPGRVLLGSLLGLAYATNLADLAGGLPVGALSHLWSLAQEEQFYLLWPPILLLALGFRLSPRRLMLALAVLATASATAQTALWLNGASIHRIWLGPDTHAYPLLFGCIAGVAFTHGMIRRIPGWLVAVACITSVSTLAFGVVEYPFFSLAATVVVLACVLEQGSVLVRPSTGSCSGRSE
jgi:peptidoglycan/LPS O-acetylase OafA/YrhL